jgi:hypothetical protein
MSNALATPTPQPKSQRRKDLERFLVETPRPMTTAEMAEAMSMDVKDVRSVTGYLVSTGALVNITGKRHGPSIRYLHKTHVKPVEPPPPPPPRVTNASMPVDPSWWARYKRDMQPVRSV